jgi:radical SAM/Cys-rich protein
LARSARALGVQVIDRCNLTILFEPGQEDLAEFLAGERIDIVASLPCYSLERVDRQRGAGVFDKSIVALQKLNALGYGQPGSGLVLNLVYNPQGPVLPPDQRALQADYERELAEHFGIRFNQLFALANMPIQRFGSTLISKGQFQPYMQLLKDNYRVENLNTVMCTNTVSVDWTGALYDCDFNQMLGLPMRLSDKPRAHLRDLLQHAVHGGPVRVADHCYGCHGRPRQQLRRPIAGGLTRAGARDDATRKSSAGPSGGTPRRENAQRQGCTGHGRWCRLSMKPRASSLACRRCARCARAVRS